MNLEMKSIKYFEANSEETYDYRAVVYLDGKPFADVSNDGHGGSDRVNHHDKSPLIKVKGAWGNKFDEIEEYFASLPKNDVGKYDWCPEGFDQKFEYWCHEQVENFLHKRNMKKEFNKYVIAKLKEDGEFRFSFYKKTKGQPDWLLKEAIKNKYEDVTIVNDLPEAEALEVWRTT